MCTVKFIPILASFFLLGLSLPLSGEIPAKKQVQSPTPVPTAPQKVASSLAKNSVLRRLVLEPDIVHLPHPGVSQRLVATGYYLNGTARDVSLECRYVSLSPRVAEVKDDGVLVAISPGQAVIEARLEGRSAKMTAHVAANTSEVSVNFNQDLLSILTIKGCNGSSCHGAIAGQNGFKLSLFGYDPEADYHMIVKASDGRRVNLLNPEQSLILLKPSATIPHGGGEVLPKDSHEYHTLLTWLKQGALYNANGPRVVRLEVFPKERVLVGIGSTQRWSVVGYLSDGTTRDMSHEVRYQVGDQGVSTISPEGVSTAAGLGITHILARAHGKVAVARVGVIDDHPTSDYPTPKSSNFIDDAVFGQLRAMNLVPSETSSDEEFLRRIYLDVI